MSEPRIMIFDEIPTIERGAGITSKSLARPKIGVQAFISGITTFPPGGGLRMHTHEVEETVTVLEGEARCDVAGQSYAFKPYDTSYVPAGVPHRFVNTGSGIMRIYWVYGGLHVTRTFTDTGETTQHMGGNDLAGL